MSAQVQNKPTAAYVLSLIGGIIGLLASLGFMALGAMAFSTYYDALDYYGSYYADFYAVDAFFGFSWTILLGLGAWMLITSILIIVFARKLNSNPMEHTKWGALILVFSIIGVGGLLGLIGGILALVYKPLPYGVTSAPPGYVPPPTYAQPTQQQDPNRICPQCGRFIDNNVKFCPHCGRQLA